MVDQRLHRLFHLGAARRRNLRVVHAHVAVYKSQTDKYNYKKISHQRTGHLVEALQNNARRLPHFLDAAKVPVVAVALGADRNLEINEVYAEEE
jgi:hypothetical protein